MAWKRERAGKASVSADRKAMQLRKSMTDAERLLWNGMRYELVMPEGAHFRRQFAIGDYVVDFVCLRYRLIIEVDGAIHAEEQRVARDSVRKKFLEKQGFTVLRFSNDDVLVRRASVVNSVSVALAGTTPIRRLTPTPSPQGGRLEPHP